MNRGLKMYCTLTQNNSVFIRKSFLFLALTLGVIVCVCNGCVSGNFKLDPQSRLPAWFHNKNNIPREKLNVDITIYETTTSTDAKVKIIISSNGKIIEKAQGIKRYHPESLKKEFPSEPPSWKIFEINGTKEIYEQREKNNILRIVDDVDK
jgi:hypothetical protein